MVKQIAVHRLKYLDEASFASRGAPPPPPPPDARADGRRAPARRRVAAATWRGAVRRAGGRDERRQPVRALLSVTIMVGLPPVGQPDAPTVFVNYRADGTNTHGV